MPDLLPPSAYDPRDPQPGVYLGVPPDVYHASLGVSSSGLQTCLKRSPAHYRWERENPPRHDYLDEGNVAHTAVLEPDQLRERLHVIDAENWTTKAAREERDSIRKERPDKYVLHRKQAEEVFAWVRSARASARLWGLDPDPFALIQAGHHEVTFVARDPETGLLLRARPDAVLFEQRIVIDLKTCHDASPETFQRDALKLGYGMRAAAYLDTIARVLGEDPADWVFLWVCIEKAPPYPLAQYSATSDLLHHGAREYRKSLDLVASCEKTGVWPSYASSIQPLDLPEYLKRELNRRAS